MHKKTLNIQNSKSKIILIGGGGHCKSVIDVIEQEDKYKILGIIDKKESVGKKVLGYKIIGSDDNLETLYKTCKYAIITVGQIEDNVARVALYEKLKNIGYKLPVIKSPHSYISKHSFIDEGTVIMHHALVNANAQIGKNCIINTKALIEHDAIIEDHCHISTASVINGGVIVEEGTFFGSNAVSVQESEIRGFIKAGSLAR